MDFEYSAQLVDTLPDALKTEVRATGGAFGRFQTLPVVGDDEAGGVRREAQVDLDFGRSHGHGDRDRMNLGLIAFGLPLSADPGSTYNYNTGASEGPAVASMGRKYVQTRAGRRSRSTSRSAVPRAIRSGS